jgi:pilus assembly protein CpaC
MLMSQLHHSRQTKIWHLHLMRPSTFQKMTFYFILFVSILFQFSGEVLAQRNTFVITKVKVGSQLNLSLVAGKSRIYEFDQPIVRMSVAAPTIADAVLISPQQLYVLGKETGATNIFVWHDNETTSVIDVAVLLNTADIQTTFTKLLPDEKNLKVTAAGESVVLSGQVTDASKVQQAVLIAEQISGKKVLNMLRTNALPQVLIEVKIAEIDKALADELGLQVSGSSFAFSAAGLGALTGAANAAFQVGTTNSFIRAQEASGLIKILAEPNIMAVSGQEGNFLAGGIVFIPVPQSSATGGGAVITLQEQSFGVGLKFTPTVMAGNMINLVVKPEVSEVSPQGVQVSTGNSQMILPIIRTRAASTTVQLMDGQTFAIGGLISNNISESIIKFPWLSDIPILGQLFRSNSFQSRRTELVILVTPRLVKPMNAQPSLPTDRYVQPTPFEFFGEGKMEGRQPSQSPAMPITAAATQPSPATPAQATPTFPALRLVQDAGY